MRQIVLDTETTGLEPESGHRVIEIGALELIERRLTGSRFHRYLNPERPVESGALRVHGLSDEFLAEQPCFADVASDFLAYIADSELVIHNAPFDVGFLNAELRRLTSPTRIEDHACVLDTLDLARQLHPGQRNSLDALCRRYEVDDSRRELHGALLDAELLAEVYLRMTGGQASLRLDLDSGSSAPAADAVCAIDRNALIVRRATAEELDAHRALLEEIDRAAGARGCLWLHPDRTA